MSIPKCTQQFNLSNLQQSHEVYCTLEGDGLTWSSFAGDPDGGWSPCYTLSGERASIAIHIMHRLDRDVIWIQRHLTVAVYLCYTKQSVDAQEQYNVDNTAVAFHPEQ